MSISAPSQAKLQTRFRRGYRPTTALAETVRFDDDMMHVSLTDGRIIGVPLAWFPSLQEATQAQRENCQIDGGGVSLHWPDIDEDISVAGLLDGADWEST